MTEGSTLETISEIDYIVWGCPRCPGESGLSLLNSGDNGVTSCDNCGYKFIVVFEKAALPPFTD
jgi:hypothetical protein